MAQSIDCIFDDGGTLTRFISLRVCCSMRSSLVSTSTRDASGIAIRQIAMMWVLGNRRSVPIKEVL